MPKSLDRGPSKSVQIKCPESDKLAIVAVLREGETLSELTRRLWRDEVKKRKFGEAMKEIFKPVPNHENFASNILKETPLQNVKKTFDDLVEYNRAALTYHSVMAQFNSLFVGGKLGEIAIEKEAKDHG